jgi:formylglycine-generating enzyme required for sulfatase activity
MADIFVSYPRAERGKAEVMVAALRALRYDVWWDDDILARERWTDAIEREIDAARAVIVLWTQQSVASANVKDEAYFALKRGKLVPVRLEACELPLSFALLQCVDLFDWRGEPESPAWARAIEAIESLTGKAPATSIAHASLGPYDVRSEATLELAWLTLKDDVNLERLRAFLKETEAHPLRQAVARRIEEVEREIASRPGSVFNDDPVLPSLVIVPAGEFDIGSPHTETGRDASEGPVTRVTLARPFAIGRFPVTRREWSAFALGAGASDRSPDFPRATPSHPVVNVSWSDATAYCKWASDVSGASYRLPTEAEWEYACRAGTTSPYWTGDAISTRQANFKPAAGDIPSIDRRSTTPVGLFPANALGLHDMHGLVWEWCADIWRPGYDRENCAPAAGRRAMRGGAWSSMAESIRSATRSSSDLTLRTNDVGFRVVRLL